MIGNALFFEYGFDLQFATGNLHEARRSTRAVIGIANPSTELSSAQAPSRVSRAIRSGALTTGGPRWNEGCDLPEYSLILLQFGDRDQRYVVLGQGLWQRLPRQDVDHVQGDVRTAEQKFERRICQEIARNHEG